MPVFPALALLRNPHLLLTVTMLIWAGNAIAGKFALGHVSPGMLTLFRWTVAFCIIAVVARDHLRADWDAIRANCPYLLAMGGFGYAAFNFLLYSALHYTSAINVALEQSAMPVIIFVLNYLIYRTGITALQVVGYLLTLAGVAVTISAGDPMALLSTHGPGVNRGDLIMAVAALCYGGYSVALRSRPNIHWQSFLTCLTAGAVVFSGIGVGLEFTSGAALFPTTLQGVLVCLYAGVFPSLVAQGFFIAGIAALGANRAGLYINLVPVFAALMAVSLLGESLQLYHAMAFVLVVGGIVIAQYRQQPDRQQPHRQQPD